MIWEQATLPHNTLAMCPGSVRFPIINKPKTHKSIWRYLLKCEFLIQDKPQNKACQHNVLMTKRIQILIVWPPHQRMPTHAPNDSQRADNEDDLHHGVVERHIVRDEIHVTSQEHKRVQLLSLERDSLSQPTIKSQHRDVYARIYLRGKRSPLLWLTRRSIIKTQSDSKRDCIVKLMYEVKAMRLFTRTHRRRIWWRRFWGGGLRYWSSESYRQRIWRYSWLISKTEENRQIFRESRKENSIDALSLLIENPPERET